MATFPNIPNYPEWAVINEQSNNLQDSLRCAQVLLTSAQLLALKTTPVAITPTPNSAVSHGIPLVRGISLSYNFVTTAYTLNAGTFKIFYGTVANAHAITADLSGSFLTATASRKMVCVPTLVVQDVNANVVGQALFAGNDGAANYTLGDATLQVTIWYTLTVI